MIIFEFVKDLIYTFFFLQIYGPGINIYYQLLIYINLINYLQKKTCKCKFSQIIVIFGTPCRFGLSNSLMDGISIQYQLSFHTNLMNDIKKITCESYLPIFEQFLEHPVGLVGKLSPWGMGFIQEMLYWAQDAIGLLKQL